ncbi:LLM class flavin-dependent oxidoreductase [Streptomyces coryli]|uniref:LLM class flavin-dependent oxidoreductase n=1 Tax=Streptomyces coryli TaxID=1128680 RepID=UPI0030B8D274
MTAPLSTLRLNLTYPDEPSPAELSDRYRAAIDLAEYADAHGFITAQVEEHHGAANGWLPAPLTLAGLILGRTKKITVMASAIIGPLYDPLRLAEELAVLDLASGGRMMTVSGIGYRPEEYEQHGVDWKNRGAAHDEVLETLLKAWTGEPFEYRGRTVQVTPRPYTQPHPLLLVGGSSKPAVRRAARLGLPFFPSSHQPALQDYYEEKCAEYGTEGWVLMPPERVPLLHVTEDPDRAWAELGKHFMHEATMYASWQTSDIKSAVKSQAVTVDELRAEGVYRFVSPDEAVEEARTGNVVLHPLCGGMPVDEAWRSLHLYAEKVLPRLDDKSA